jgi:hypothetical protein
MAPIAFVHLRTPNCDGAADSDYYLIGVIEYSVSDPLHAWLKTGQYLTRGLIHDNRLNLPHFRATH